MLLSTGTTVHLSFDQVVEQPRRFPSTGQSGVKDACFKNLRWPQLRTRTLEDDTFPRQRASSADPVAPDSAFKARDSARRPRPHNRPARGLAEPACGRGLRARDSQCVTSWVPASSGLVGLPRWTRGGQRGRGHRRGGFRTSLGIIRYARWVTVKGED